MTEVVREGSTVMLQDLQKFAVAMLLLTAARGAPADENAPVGTGSASVSVAPEAGANPLPLLDGSEADDLDALLDLADEDLGQVSRVNVTAPSLDMEVTSVSRRKSTVGRSPAAVFVITQEMIRRSGHFHSGSAAHGSGSSGRTNQFSPVGDFHPGLWRTVQ